MSDLELLQLAWRITSTGVFAIAISQFVTGDAWERRPRLAVPQETATLAQRLRGILIRLTNVLIGFCYLLLFVLIAATLSVIVAPILPLIPITSLIYYIWRGDWFPSLQTGDK